MGMFSGTLCFSAGFSYDELMVQFKKTKADGWATALSKDKDFIDQGFAFGLKRTCKNSKTGKTQKFFFLILKECFDFTDYHYCVLAHELIHILQFYLVDVLDRDNEIEAEAYLHTFLMEKCLKVIRG